MSVKTIYTCERCKKEQAESRDFHTIGIIVEPGAQDVTSSGYGNKRAVLGKQMQVCTECLETMGLSKFIPAKPVPPNQPPTIDDLIRDIVSDHVSDALANQ